MLGSCARACGRVGRGVAAAVRERPVAFLGVSAAVVALDIALPPLVLSVARKPVDYFTFNPWLTRLPEYLTSPVASWDTKLAKLWELALFWFSADSPHGGVEWGFAVDVGDLGRIALLGALCGAYFVLWWRARGGPGRGRAPAVGAGRGGVAGALAGVVGLSTGPCSGMGCGAPVLPVLGLAFVGLSSGTLAWLARVSAFATTTVLVALGLGVLHLGWVVGGEPRPAPGARRAAPPSAGAPPG